MGLDIAGLVRANGVHAVGQNLFESPATVFGMSAAIDFNVHKVLAKPSAVVEMSTEDLKALADNVAQELSERLAD